MAVIQKSKNTIVVVVVVGPRNNTEGAMLANAKHSKLLLAPKLEQNRFCIEN
jgi:hypothetical protein